jgi:uncharacterized protein (TIGR01244 family)
MKRILTVVVFLMFGASGYSQDSIRNYLRVNEDFCTAGQPTIEDLTALRDDGNVAILNLRLPDEHDAAAEQAAAEELGMKYFNIPVVGSDPQDSQAAEFLALTDDPENRPMFIHCGSANRVGAFWMIRRVLRDGWDLEAAQTEAEEIGMRAPGLRTFALSYIERNQE